MTSGAREAVAKGYNGWPNYETWAVSLWLDNDEPSYRHWRAMARQMRAFAPDSRYLWDENMSREEAAKCELADRLQMGIEDRCPEIGPTMYADLLRAALAEVNWLSIAEHMLADLE